MPDQNGYPTRAELAHIKRLDARKDWFGLLDHLKAIWWYPDRHIQIKGKRVLNVWFHTGGWSGNEDIIRVLQKSFFWLLFWQQSNRGGHYHFKVKLARKERRR